MVPVRADAGYTGVPNGKGPGGANPPALEPTPGGRCLTVHAYATPGGSQPQPLRRPDPHPTTIRPALQVDPSRRDLLARYRSGIGSFLASLGRTAPGRAYRYLLRVIADRSLRRPNHAASWLVEVAASYLAEGVEVGILSARAALAAVRSTVRECVVPPAEAAAMGWALRPLLTGRRRGPLRMYPVEFVAAAREAVDLLDAEGDGERPTGRTWRTMAGPDLAALGYAPAGGTGRKRICPHHNDHDPSLVLFGDHEIDRCGPAYCHGGCGPLHWTRTEDGSIWSRPAAPRHNGSEDVTGTDPGPPTGSSFVIGPVRGVRSSRSVVPRSVVGGVRPGLSVSGEAVARLLGSAEGHVVGDRSAAGFRRRWGPADPIRCLVWADRSGPVAEGEAVRASCLAASGAFDPRVVLPDRYLSVGRLRADRVDLRPVPRGDPGDMRAIAVPTAYSAGAQGWILVDLDDLSAAGPSWDRAGAVEAVRRVVTSDPTLTGRLAVVETSPTGVQVWAERIEEVADPARWWRSRDTRRWYASFGGAILDAIRVSGRSGGKVDETAAAAGRYGRRTGWRLVDGIWPFRVRLLGAVLSAGDDPVDGREARRRLVSARRSRGGPGSA